MPSLHKEALTACRHSVSDTISFPLSGCFSPFPHGTSSLSVIKEYLGLGSGLPIFRQNFTCSALLENNNTFYLYGTITLFGLTFQKVHHQFRSTATTPHLHTVTRTDSARPLPFSFAITHGISIDFFSSGYWDVSIHRVPDHKVILFLRIKEVLLGNLEIKGCMRLPPAFRSLPRPSSVSQT